MKKQLFIFLFVFSAATLFAQNPEKPKDCVVDTATVYGIFRGKNLIIQNPTATDKGLCLLKIFVGKKEIACPKDKPVFEIPLVSLSLKQNETIAIKFTSCKNATSPYRILNPEVIK